MPTKKRTGQIILKLNENCKGDTMLEGFLRRLCMLEAEHPGQWRWKDEYLHLLEEIFEKQGGSNADKPNKA